MGVFSGTGLAAVRLSVGTASGCTPCPVWRPAESPGTGRADRDDMNRLLASVTALAATCGLVAQDPQPGAAVPPPDRLARRAETMRNQIDAGVVVRSHVRVAVRLKNGNKLRGVVKDGKMVERVDGLRFVDAQAKDTGAGIRLWYTSGARNYVFVPFSDFSEYQVLQRLTPKELEQMESELQIDERKRAEAAAAKAAEQGTPEGAEPVPTAETDPAAKPPGEQTPAAGDVKPTDGKPTDGKPAAGKPEAEATAESALAETHKKWFALLQDYPPAAGWNKAKRDEIARRMVVIGARPSPHEQRFVDQFAEWEKACQHFVSEKDQKPADGETEGQTEGEPAEAESGNQSGRRKKK